ncbi:hypothetical protein BDY24DRAFT_415173 [Mrakia frigida]|uniref:uncharacterized protein n=1 Tax=Mrakia frigida TaxID=29902 RepID=UPI003FCBF15F
MSRSAPDSPWTSRLKASKEEGLREAILAAKEEEKLELTNRVQQLNSLLLRSLQSHSSPNLDSLVDLHRALDLHPSDVSSSAILSRLDRLSQQSTSLEIDLLKARQAVKVLAREQVQLDLLQEEVTSLSSTLSSSRPPPTAAFHDDSIKDKKAEEYSSEILRLQQKLEKSRSPDISLLLERTEVLEELEKRNERTKKEVGRFKGLPADYDLARLHVEEERRKLRELQALRDDAMANALVSR